MNEEEKQEIPFTDVLTMLLTDEMISVAQLYRLSDMSPTDNALFASQWQNASEERRGEIMRHLADLNEENFLVDFSPVFAYGLRDAEVSVRLAALDGVWDTTDTTLISPIIELMQQDSDTAVRAAAAAALAHYVLMAEWGEVPRSVAPPIVEAFLITYDAPDTAVPIKRAVLEALGASHHPRVPQLIREAYESDIFEMQLSAIFAMGNSADREWMPVILSEMDNEYMEMRAEAARAAGAIGSSDAVSQLAELVADEEQDVALAAISALGLIGGQQVHEILDEYAQDPEFEALHEALDEAMEEIDWLAGEFELSDFDVAE